MTLLGRIFRILQASVTADDSPPAAPPETGGGGRPSTEDWHAPAEPPAVDQRLAGYYANLEIPYGADLATARRAWKRLMKKYHPDLHAQDPERRRLANQVTAELTRACQGIEAATSGKEKV
jgi:DnaJ-domain-containing protein 1